MPSTAVIGRYKKKPVVIEAVRYIGDGDAAAIIGWCGGLVRPGSGIVIETLEGEMLASPGDWIIKGIEGEYYPCKDSVFRESYELA